MAKKQWTLDGTDNIITAALQQAYWGIDADTGHTHQGTDVDGDCPKIDLADSVGDYLTGTFGIDVTSTYFTAPVSDETAWYTKVGNMVHVTFPDIFDHHVSSTELQLTPNGGDWPAAIIPATPQLVSGIIGQPNAAAVALRSVLLNIPAVTSSNIICSITDASGIFLTTGWGTVNTAPKGIYRRTLSWYVDTV